MQTRDTPSLANRILTPSLTLLCGLSAGVWFFYRVIFLFQNISSTHCFF